MTALMVGHAIFTTGKNTPTPGTGTRMRRVFASTTIVSGYLALLVTGCIDCGGETRAYSVQVGTGIFLHKYCISSFQCFVLCFVKSEVILHLR